MTLQEAREALSFEVDSDNPPYTEIMRLADAYAAARALAAHVDACIWHMTPKDDHNINMEYVVTRCGDGWYCEKAKAIQELGR